MSATGSLPVCWVLPGVPLASLHGLKGVAAEFLAQLLLHALAPVLAPAPILAADVPEDHANNPDPDPQLIEGQAADHGSSAACDGHSLADGQGGLVKMVGAHNEPQCPCEAALRQTLAGANN